MAIQKVSDLYKIIQTAGDTYQGNELDQTYSLNPAFVAAGETITIIDQGGVNAIELVGGLSISSSIVAANEIQLTLSNGAIINIRGADTFAFNVGANQAGGIAGTELNFTSFVEDVLGTTVPTEGTTTGGSVTIGNDGGGEIIPPPIGGDPVDDSIPITGSVFTLKDIPDTHADPVLMWDDITAANFLDFLVNIAGIDVAQLGLIDDLGNSTISSVTNISVGSITPTASADNNSGTAGTQTSTITFTTNDGQTITTEAALGAEYLAFLQGFIFDANGNSRLSEVSAVTPGGAVVLTTTENNGGTVESGVTTVSNDLIVAGRTELLHGAYIDAGEGLNVLEVDMKGVYAQPLMIKNVQQIQVQNLPNVYGDTSPSDYLSAGQAQNSILDLSRAIDLEHLIITEGYNTGTALGSLTVVGIRNGAPVKLEGGFSEDVFLHYGQGLGRAVDLQLNLGDTDGNFDLFIAQNSNELNIDSQGSENWLNDGYFGGSLRTLNITGNAALYIQGDLDTSFQDGRTATINASTNLGGVDLTIDAQPDVEFFGSQGDDDFTATFAELVSISDTTGNNTLNTDNSQMVNIVVGDGNNDISSRDSVKVNISTGNGNNTLKVGADIINVTTADGDDSLAIFGTATASPSVLNAAMLNIDLGTGSNTLTLGTQDSGNALVGVVAQTGSVISGENITVQVATDSDLSEAALTGITAFVLNGGNLRITPEQFIATGPANFSVDDSAFGQAGQLTIVMNADMALSDLGDLTQLTSAIKLNVEVPDATTLSVTAEELHTYIAENGINVDDANGYIDNQVVITNAGLTFDAFGQQNGGLGGGTVASGVDVTIIREINGFERPAEDALENTWTINSDDTPVVDLPGDDIDASAVTTVIMEGTAPITFVDSLTLANDFQIDFSALVGALTGLTISNFEDINATDLADNGIIDGSAAWGSIIGNGLPGTRVNLEFSAANQMVGYDNNDTGGFFSSGVDTYVVTGISGMNNFIYVCDQTQDVTTLGLQGNYAAGITFGNVRWDTAILAQGDGFADWTGLPKALGNPNTSNVGTIVANYFTDGAQAVVNINNNGVALGADSTGGVRALHVAGLTINNADTLTVNVEDGNAVIEMIAGDSVNALVVNSAGDVTIQGTVDNLADLESFDASGVTATFTLDLNSGVNDLSAVALAGLDVINFSGMASLTITVDQALTANISTDTGVQSTLSLVDLAGQEIDVTAIDVFDIGTVAVQDVSGTVVLHANTVLGNGTIAADSLEISALTSDTTVEMMAVQFNQLAGDAQVGSDVGVDATTGDDFIATLVVTDLASDSDVNMTNVGQGTAAGAVSQVVRINDTVSGVDDAGTAAAENIVFTGLAAGAVLEVAGGNNDLTAAAGVDGFGAVRFTADSVLNITADQITGIGEGNFSVASGVSVTVNVTDLGANSIDLDMLAAAGINIGEVSIVDNATPGAVAVTLHPDTTLGDADALITPTINANDTNEFAEDTSLFISAAQFNGLANGTITGDGTVNITGLVANTNTDADPTTLDEVLIDTTNVTAPQGTITLGENDVTIHVDSILSGFSITLNDVDSTATANELAGQIIRFNTAVQAERAILVTGFDPAPGEDDTSVVWLFDAITGTATSGKVDTVNYDPELGRVWMLDNLVNGANVEELFTSLSDAIIIRVATQKDLLALTNPINRVVEIEAFVDLPGGLTFNDIDGATAPFDFVANLTFDIGGATNIGNIEVDNVLAASVNNDDEFQVLTINSILANTDTHYLLPENFDTALNPRPDELFNPADRINTIGDISSGASREVLSDVVLNTNGSVGGNTGTGLNIGTITFSEDGQEGTEGFDATLTVNGSDAVTIASLNTDDTDIHGLVVNNAGTGTLTITGASPAAAVSNTESLTINATGNVTLGTAADVNKPGVFGPDLSFITLTGTGDVNLDVIAGLDGTIDATVSPIGFVLDATGSTGDISLTLDKATVGTPTLGAADAWTFSFNAASTVAMTITNGVVFTAGGQLTLDQVDTLTIEGAVDLSVLGTDLAITNSAIVVPTGATLTLTAEQADGLTITGGGTVEITALEATPAADLGNIMTATGDTGVVNAAVNTADGPDADTLPEAIDLSGNIGVATITISGDGSVSVSGAMGPIDRNNPATADTSDDTTPAFVVGTNATLNLTATQVGNATGTVTTSWKVNATGTGTVNVADLGLNPDADLSGLTATTLNAAVDTSVTFTGDLGAAALTIATGAVLTSDSAVVTGLSIAGAGTLTINDTVAQAMDLSNVTADFINFDSAAVLGTVTFPVLREADATVTPAITAQTVNMTSVQANGQNLTGANSNAGGVVIIDVIETDTNAFNLSGIAAGTLTATVSANYTLAATSDWGTFDVVIAAGTTTMTGAQANGLTITGAGTLELTNLTGGEDLSNITVGVTTTIADGNVDLSGVTGLTAIDIADPAPDASTVNLTVMPEQFAELNAGTNNMFVDAGFANSLIVDESLVIGSSTIALDLTYVTATTEITGPASGFVEAKAASAADTGEFNTFLGSGSVTQINQTDLGSVASATTGAAGLNGQADHFIYNANPISTPTAITAFVTGDGDKLDVSNFGDADSTITVLDPVNAAVNITIAANEVYFYSQNNPGDADTLAAASAAINGSGAWQIPAADTTAYFVIADDNSSAIYQATDIAGSNDEIAVTELTLIGTVDAVLLGTDILA